MDRHEVLAKALECFAVTAVVAFFVLYLVFDPAGMLFDAATYLSDLSFKRKLKRAQAKRQAQS